MNKKITLKGFGPLKQITEIPAQPGIVILRGRNGAGKTTTIEAVEATVSKKSPPKLSDGESSATVDAEAAFGVKLTVGKTSRRSGELTVKTIEGKLDISDIVDPKLKTPEAADAARIKALVKLADVQPSPSLFVPLLGDQELFEKVTSPSTRETPDIVLMAERIKRDFEAAARVEECNRDTALGHAQANEQSIEGIDLQAPSERSQLSEALENAIRTESRLQAEYREAQRAATEHEAANARLAELTKMHGDLDKAGAEKRLGEAQDAREAASSKVARLEDELRNAKQALREADATLSHSQQMLSKINQAEQSIEAVRSQVATKPAAGPSLADLEAAEQVTIAARQAFENGALIRNAIKQASDALGQRMLAEQHAKQAEKLRTAASGTDDILSQQIAKFFSQVWVEGGRLKTETPRGKEFVHELSPGMIGRIAVEIGVKAVGGNGLLTLSQEVWEGLDPVNRDEIDAIAKEAGVMILTAQCSADETVRAEVYSE